MKSGALVLVGALLTAALDGEEARVVVHEWGTFTSVAAEDGMPVPWRALSQPWELPDFVYQDPDPRLPTDPPRPRGVKPSLRGLVRLETPVVYVYASRATRLSVQVDFPGGRLTEWYPAAAARPDRLRWPDLEVRPGEAAVLPVDRSGSHYYDARVAAAAPLRVETDAGSETESFLFYRGVGQWSPPVFARLDRGRLAISSFDARLARALVFEARDGRTSWRAAELRSGSARVARPTEGDAEGAREALRRLIVEGGLYAEEAEAMLRTWDGSWFEEGLRVFYVVPPAIVERVLPLRVSPAPSELRRVLVGRLEVLTPERERWAAGRLAELPANGPPEEALLQLGRFAEPLLRRIGKSSADPQLRSRIDALLAAP